MKLVDLIFEIVINEGVSKGNIPHNKGVSKYSLEYLNKIKEKYNGKPLYDFKNGEDKNVYKYVVRQGENFRLNFTKDMVREAYTDKQLEDIAKKYNTKNEFRVNDEGALKAAIKRGPFVIDSISGKKINTYEFYDKITSHMQTPHNYSKRLVYVFEFYDENNKPIASYIGLTNNSDKRKDEHLHGVNRLKKQKLTSVTKFLIKNPKLHYQYKELSGYVDSSEAVELEKYWENKYRNVGWEILNIQKTGALGPTGISVKKLREIVDYAYEVDGIRTLKDFRAKYKHVEHRIRIKGLDLPPFNLLDKFERKFKVTKLKNIDDLIKSALEYKTYDELKKDVVLVGKLKYRNLIDDVKKLFIERELNQTNKQVDEIATKEKELVGKGSFHNVYPSNKNPNMVYKIGFDEDVNGWVDLFKSRPDIFPKVYGTGHVNIKLKKQVTNFSWRTGEFKPITYNPGDTVKVKYVGVERLNTEKAKQHWNSLANVVSVMSGKSLQTYLTSLGIDEEMEEEFLSIGEKIKETGNDFIYNIFVEFYNLIHSVYELKPVADVHVGNYGYDKDGNLKCLDI